MYANPNENPSFYIFHNLKILTLNVCLHTFEHDTTDYVVVRPA